MATKAPQQWKMRKNVNTKVCHGNRIGTGAAASAKTKFSSAAAARVGRRHQGKRRLSYRGLRKANCLRLFFLLAATLAAVIIIKSFI